MGDLKMKTNEKLILLNQSFADSEAVIDALAGLAKSQGLVEDIFIEKIKEREKDYPTGLPMGVPLAIPHISDGCNEPFVSIATLKEPVVFYNMDRGGDEIPVQIVFLFGIIDPKSQLAVLRQFARAFANAEAVQKLLDADTPKGLLTELDSILEGLLNIT